MSITELIIIPILSGIAASMGLGGGTFLIVWLTAFSGMSQLEAQGINLVFFIPIAAASLIFHSKVGLVEWKKILPAVICGVALAIVFSILANKIPTESLRKLFGAFILLAGMKTLATKKKM